MTMMHERSSWHGREWKESGFILVHVFLVLVNESSRHAGFDAGTCKV